MNTKNEELEEVREELRDILSRGRRYQRPLSTILETAQSASTTSTEAHDCDQQFANSASATLSSPGGLSSSWEVIMNDRDPGGMQSRAPSCAEASSWMLLDPETPAAPANVHVAGHLSGVHGCVINEKSSASSSFLAKQSMGEAVDASSLHNQMHIDAEFERVDVGPVHRKGGLSMLMDEYRKNLKTDYDLHDHPSSSNSGVHDDETRTESKKGGSDVDAKIEFPYPRSEAD